MRIYSCVFQLRVLCWTKEVFECVPVHAALVLPGRGSTGSSSRSAVCRPRFPLPLRSLMSFALMAHCSSKRLCWVQEVATRIGRQWMQHQGQRCRFVHWEAYGVALLQVPVLTRVHVRAQLLFTNLCIASVERLLTHSLAFMHSPHSPNHRPIYSTTIDSLTQCAGACIGGKTLATIFALFCINNKYFSGGLVCQLRARVWVRGLRARIAVIYE